MSADRCCPGHGTMAHVRGCVNHPEHPATPDDDTTAGEWGLRARMEALADQFDAKGRRGSAHFGSDVGDTIRLWIDRNPLATPDADDTPPPAEVGATSGEKVTLSDHPEPGKVWMQIPHSNDISSDWIVADATDWLAARLSSDRERIALAIEAEDCGTREQIVSQIHDGCPDQDAWPAAECRGCGVAAKAWDLGVEHMRTDAARIARAEQGTTP